MLIAEGKHLGIATISTSLVSRVRPDTQDGALQGPRAQRGIRRLLARARLARSLPPRRRRRFRLRLRRTALRRQIDCAIGPSRLTVRRQAVQAQSMHAPSSPPVIAGLSEIAPDYDAAICDVWGVLHNGKRMFAPAIDAMRRFRAERGPVVLVSNAPRPPEGVIALFDKLDIPHDFYDAIVTSGGEAREDLVRRTADGKRLKLFYLGPSRDHPLFEGLNIELTEPDDAELVLCTGFYDDETETPDDYRDLLDHFRLRGLTFLCANPDIVVQRGDKLDLLRRRDRAPLREHGRRGRLLRKAL